MPATEAPEPADGPLSRLVAAEQAVELAGSAALRWRAALTAASDDVLTEQALDDLLVRALEAVREFLGADTASFLAATVDGDQLVARATVGLESPRLQGVSIPAGTGLAGRVLSRREGTVVHDLSTVELASPMLRDIGVRSVVAVPVQSGDEVFGVLHAGAFRTGSFSSGDLAALGVVADRLAAAIERVQLFQSEREARERAELLARRLRHLQTVTDRLSGSRGPDDVVDIVCRETTAFLGEETSGCAIWLAGSDGELRLVQPEQTHPVFVGMGTVAPPSSPPDEVFRSGRAAWIDAGSVPTLALGSRPEVEDGGIVRLALLPLTAQDLPIGVLAIGTAGSTPFDEAERSFIGALAQQAAQAIDRSRLGELDRATRFHDEFIASVSTLLGRSLDLDVTLDHLARLLVPTIADMMTIHLFDDDGVLTRVSVVHRDRAVEAAILAAAPTEVPAVAEAIAVAAEGETVLVDDLPTVMGRVPHPAEVAQALAPLGISSILLVPLADAASRLGVLSLAQSASGRQFDPPTRRLVEAVGRRTAVAVGNARLHSEIRRSERAQRFLLDVARALAGTSGFVQTLERLGAVAVPTLGDLCVIDILDDEGGLERLVAHHADPGRQSLVRHLLENPPDPAGPHPAAAAIRDAKTVWSDQLPPSFFEDVTRDREHRNLVEQLAVTSFIAVPLSVDDRVLGSLTLVASGSGRRFTRADVELTERLASHVALVVDKARRYELAHEISHTLQASLLAPLPHVPGVRIAARYLPGTVDAEVGGDFYDAVLLADGTLVLGIGDVAGHDLRAAAMMGNLRSAVRTLDVQGSGPGATIDGIRSSWELLGMTRIATMLRCRLDPTSGSMVLASAGHPPPLVVGVDGARYLPVTPSPPLGWGTPGVEEWHGHLEAGTTLLLYTDGVIEDRSGELDRNLAELLRVASEGPTDVELLCDRVVDTLGDDRFDDAALLAVARSAS